MRDRDTATRPEPPQRRRVLALALLTLATLALGVAVRRPSAPGPDPAATPGSVTAGAGPLSLSVRLDRHALLRGGDGRVRAELVIAAAGDDAPLTRGVPTDLVVVLDRSGSMQGEPLAAARAAVRELVGELAPGDRFALVTYATGGSVAIPLEAATPDARERWSRQLAGFEASGGTNLARGLDLAHELLARAQRAGRAPRVVVLSDGHANQGDHSLGGLRRRAGRAIGGEYVLSAVGVGPGFDETLMSALADAGTGNFYYLPDAQRLAGVFAAEFASARETLVSGLELSIAPAPGVAVEDAGGYPLERDDERVRFHPGDLATGQTRRIWVTLRATPERNGTLGLGALSLAWTELGGERRRLRLPALPEVTIVTGEDDYFASFDADVYARGNRSEAFGALKQRVAAKLRAGEQAGALAAVDEFLAEQRREQPRALGRVDHEGLAAAESLRDAVAAPSAAEPAVRNHLGKQLLEEGRDLRRSGSKRDPRDSGSAHP